MNKNISNEQIKSIEKMISKKKENMDFAFFYCMVVWVEKEEKAVYPDVVPYTKFKEAAIRNKFIMKWHNNLTAMAMLDYYVARLDYEEALELESIIH